jgi:Pyruvate/2-oxoacid:ferredoxin oxidoreductase delta subunit
MMKPVIIKEKCAAQPQICPSMKACKPDAMKFVEDENEPLGGRIEIDYAICDGCGDCIGTCCGTAISFVANA